MPTSLLPLSPFGKLLQEEQCENQTYQQMPKFCTPKGH